MITIIEFLNNKYPYISTFRGVCILLYPIAILAAIPMIWIFSWWWKYSLSIFALKQALVYMDEFFRKMIEEEYEEEMQKIEQVTASNSLVKMSINLN